MNILFLCTGNSCRSQIAEAFGRQHEHRGHRIFSAGTDPQGVHPRTLTTLTECNVDASSQESKDISAIPVGELDLVISLCSSAIEHFPPELAGIAHEHWPLEDPAAVSGDEDNLRCEFARIRDDIHARVDRLLG